MKFQCRSENLVAYGEYIRRFCREQCNQYLILKRKCERANWNDNVFVQFATEMNEAGSNIIDALDQLSDGVRVRTITQLSPLVEEYLKTASNFPIV